MLENLIISKKDAPYKSDLAAWGARSRWLQSEQMRLRVIIYPAGFEADHVCYKGHAIYVAHGTITIEFGNNMMEWQEGDAFIVPDDIPHVVFNKTDIEAKVLVFDTGH